jgi:hypothetical protein
MLNQHIAFVIAQALHRNAVRWARREQSKLLERERLLEQHTKQIEPAEDAHFESVALLSEFLDYSVRAGILSQFERDLLLRVKVDGLVAKEVPQQHTALSPKAVHVRIQRIIKRLQDAAWTLPFSNANPTHPMESVEPIQMKNLSQSMSTFSLSTFSGGAAISVNRRPLSLDSSPSRSKTKTQQFSSIHRNLLAFATPPKAIRRTRVISGAARQPLAANQASGSPLTLSRPIKSGEGAPSNPDAGLPATAGAARIIRKELVGNEEISAKENCVPLARYEKLAPSRTSGSLVLAHLRISGIRSSHRRLAVGERGQRLDAGVHDHHRSRPVARFHCGGGPHLRFW